MYSYNDRIAARRPLADRGVRQDAATEPAGGRGVADARRPPAAWKRPRQRRRSSRPTGARPRRRPDESRARGPAMSSIPDDFRPGDGHGPPAAGHGHRHGDGNGPVPSPTPATCSTGSAASRCSRAGIGWSCSACCTRRARSSSRRTCTRYLFWTGTVAGLSGDPDARSTSSAAAGAWSSAARWKPGRGCSR